MTGIERLRELANATNCSVWACTDEIYCESHGLDGSKNFGGRMRDALNDIADQIEREQNEMVADSPYDALPPEDRDAIAWVREHGGLERVRSHWDGYVPAAWLDRVKRSCERKRDRLKGHAWELEHKCAERRERIAELERQRSEAVSAQLASDAALYDLRREVRHQCQAFGVDVSMCETASEMLHDMNEELSFRLMPEGMADMSVRDLINLLEEVDPDD